jgi:hypothetical protein
MSKSADNNSEISTSTEDDIIIGTNEVEDEVAFKFHSNNSKVLIVWFGGMREPFFGKRFADESGFDCLYFRDSGFDWYTKGLAGVADNIELSAAWLNSFKLGKYDFVCFCGQSSGGYGALYFGLHCSANLCIVFAPQIKNVFDGQCRMSPHVPLMDLYEQYRNQNPKVPKVILNLSRSEKDHLHEFAWDDFKQVENFKNLDCVTTIIHPYDNHATSFKLSADGILYRFLIANISQHYGV